ncbi:ankyrin repeat-containing protein [Anaeramoeba flamelloides]|uniref:Ankyrin repeat-containing protein n=1 Tax=Anaeramoeba flamelloides TaxID=1746091 RepID=A0AAV7ZQ41_9EUKA|nr:ankyrin repeat-containing protein [Anaeramoeba flamelloides]
MINHDFQISKRDQELWHLFRDNIEDYKTIECLIKKGASLRVVNKQAPIHSLVRHVTEREYFPDKLKCIKKMLDKDHDLLLLQDGKTPLHYTLQFKYPIEQYKLLTSYPVSQYEIPDIDKITPLHLFCKQINHYEKNFEDFLGKITNFDPRDIFKRTPLHYLLKSNPKKKCVKALLECGVDVNSKDSITPLHYVTFKDPHKKSPITSKYQFQGKENESKKKKKKIPSINLSRKRKHGNLNQFTLDSDPQENLKIMNEQLKKSIDNHNFGEDLLDKEIYSNLKWQILTSDLLIKNGANLDIQDKWLPEEHIHTNVLSGQLRSYRTFTHDFHDLIKYEYGWNFEMATKKILKCHTCIFNYRFQNKITPEMINTVFESPKIKDIRPFIYWVYTGLLSVPKDKELIQNILLTLGHLDLFEIKNTRSKFLQDIEKIMNQNIGVDFKILLKDKYFFVHKIILVARLSWFRNKLLNPNGQFNSISILKINSSCTIKSFEIFISFVYTGRIDDNLNQDLVDELLVLCDHYGLSKYSALYYQILVSHLRNKEDDN